MTAWTDEQRLRCAALLHQQCWCWGHDVRRAEGNLLLEAGFTRQRPPAGETGASMYRRLESDGAVVTLWGFGLHLAEDGTGVYLNRFEAEPRLGRDVPVHVWQREQVAHWLPARCGSERGTARRLAARACAWVAAYEQWVQAAAGVAYRDLSLAEWEEAVVPGPDMPAAWLGLARSLDS